MRLLIAGSRSWSPTDDEITIALSYLPSTVDPVEAVVSGGARGADLAGERVRRRYYAAPRAFLRLRGELRRAYGGRPGAVREGASS